MILRGYKRGWGYQRRGNTGTNTAPTRLPSSHYPTALSDTCTVHMDTWVFQLCLPAFYCEWCERYHHTTTISEGGQSDMSACDLRMNGFKARLALRLILPTMTNYDVHDCQYRGYLSKTTGTRRLRLRMIAVWVLITLPRAISRLGPRERRFWNAAGLLWVCMWIRAKKMQAAK